MADRKAKAAAQQLRAQYEKEEKQTLTELAQTHPRKNEGERCLLLSLTKPWKQICPPLQAKVVAAFKALTTDAQNEHMLEIAKHREIDPETTITALRAHVPRKVRGLDEEDDKT